MTNSRLVHGAAVILGILFAFPTGATAGEARGREDLNGPWEYVKVSSLDPAPPASGWRPCDVPGYLRGTQYERAWLRRDFEVPESIRGKRIKVHLGGVKYNSRVLVNGQRVGGCFGGYRPFEVDVTDAVRFDRANELLVGVHDWTGVFTPGKVDLSEGPNWLRMRGRPKDKILSPIGGVYDCYGIWDDVTLVAHDPVYVKDLFIQPSVRRRELVVEYTLANEGDVDVSPQLTTTVEGDRQRVLTLPQKDGRIAAGGSARVAIRQPWDSPRLWSPDDPHLYHLRTRLSSGDELITRFGFREFRVDGHHFYLNGNKTNLLATSWWPPRSPMTRDEIRGRWETVKQMGCVAFRTHTQPWRSVHYDVADELGLLMIVEGAVWNDESVYRINDPAFWDNYAGHLKSMIDRDKNRPSVVMWSLENEFYGGRFNDDAPAKADLVRMGRLVKQWDPTRPMFYESDGDPGGVADAIGIHYPHEYPQYTCWPNEAYWLADPRPHWGHQFTNGQPEFFWRKDKPLYVGEFLWLPSSDPSWHTVFFGDDAYRDYRLYRNRGKAQAWKMQILGYRHHEVAGISPWTVIEGGPLTEDNELLRAHQYAYQKIAAYCHDYDTRFYSGREIKRRIEVFNDVPDVSTLDLTWEFAVADKVVDKVVDEVVDKGTSQLKLGPGDHQMVDVVLHVPELPSRSPAVWRVTLHRDGQNVFEDRHSYKLYPFPTADFGGVRIGLYDPAETTGPVLRRMGVGASPVAELTALAAGVDVLVIGASALREGPEKELAIGEVPPVRQALMDFVAGGGRLLVLRQQMYPRGWFDLSLSRHKSTMTFPLDRGHQALRGLDADDLKFWRGDHLVTDHEIPRPATGGWQSIVVSGCRDGLDHAPLIERRVDRGVIVHCQLKLIEKAGAEPAADRLLWNLLDYLGKYRPPRSDTNPNQTALFGGDDEYQSVLHGLGLHLDNISDADSAAKWAADRSLIICRGGLPNDSVQLRQFVHEGGSLYVHRVSPEMIERLRQAFDLDLELQPHAGSVVRRGDMPAPFGWMAREDLYWLGLHEGISWSTTPRAREMADSIFGRQMGQRPARAFEIEQWQLDGQIVERRGDEVTLATVGSATTEIDFPKTGTYLFGIVGRGSPCDDGWPIARVSVDGKPIGQATVSSRTRQMRTTFGTVERGRRRVTVAFVNDASNQQAGEDRNLYLDQLLLAHDENPNVTFLTSPPAVAVIEHGAGRIVIDQLRWDTERRNARKAARYAGGMLTALGGDFAPRFGVAVQCETMQPEPGMPHFHVFDDHVGQATNGTLSKSIRIGKTGRYRLELYRSRPTVAQMILGESG